MEELLELRQYIEKGRYADALTLIGEMEEMSRDDKINKIENLLEVLLLHLIKQHAEKRTTRSWDVSVRNSIDQIVRTNKRRRAGGYYLESEALEEATDESYIPALRRASLEAFGGLYRVEELAEMVDEEQVKREALALIQEAQASH